MKKKKKVSTNYVRKYNKLFKFLSFDLRFTSCLLITILLLLYFFLVLKIYHATEIDPTGQGFSSL